jgi:hypothetical protein
VQGRKHVAELAGRGQRPELGPRATVDELTVVREIEGGDAVAEGLGDENVPSSVMTLPLGNQRSSATSVTVPSGSMRCSEAVAIGSPFISSKPKFPT